MTRVLGIELYDLNIERGVKSITEDILAHLNNNKLISATGAHGLVTAKKDKEFQNILNRFYINLPDGMPAVWVGRLKGAKKMERCFGPDFFAALMEASAKENINHFFCGGKEGVALQLKQACLEKFSNKNVVGCYSPPFRDMTEEEMQVLADKIQASGAHIVWIGLSTPKQEKFAYRLSKYTKAAFIICVGAAFDYYTGSIKKAPKWMQKSGLEWFYRLLQEPKRLYKRYLSIVPLFIYYNLKEFIIGK